MHGQDERYAGGHGQGRHGGRPDHIGMAQHPVQPRAPGDRGRGEQGTAADPGVPQRDVRQARRRGAEPGPPGTSTA